MERGEKTEIVLEYLRNGIASGKWTHALLPKEMDLAKQFGVARGTVRRAFDHLVSEGLVSRKKHYGTVLNEQTLKSHCICSVIRASGHFYSDVFDSLQKKITRNGYRMQHIDVYGYDKPKMRKHILRGVNHLLSLPNADKFILDGYIFNDYPRYSDILKKKPVFFDFFDNIPPDNVTGVLIDYEEAGKIGAKYLLQAGCRHPLLILGDNPAVKKRYTPECFAKHKVKQFINGYSEVLKQNGFDPMLYIYYSTLDKKSILDQLYEIFSTPSCRPDGIFADSDTFMVRILRIATECGYTPEHLIGCYDTPWSRGDGGFTFPSIRIPAEVCAEELLNQVMLPPHLRKNIFIKPETL